MRQTKLLLLVVLFAGLWSPAWALQSDRKKPIDIQADRVEVDQRTQTSQYIGNVHLVQGSMKIQADNVVVYMDKGSLQKIIITGNPAHFQQIPDNRKSLVTSTAQQMEYYAGQQRLYLKHNAEVNQGLNHFRGEFIEYDTRTSTVKANKGTDSQSRVHAIIQPSSDKDNAADKPGPPSGGQPATGAAKP